MKNYWLEAKKVRERYDRYTVYLYTMTPHGPVYFLPQQFAPEVKWDLQYAVTVYGFAFFDGKTLVRIHTLVYPAHANTGDQVVGRFDIKMLP